MKSKFLMTFVIIATWIGSIQAQKFYTKSGEISFFSSTPMEDILAKSNSASSVFDVASQKIQWAVLIKSFEFKKALMQEHFNENYMESTTFPKASFDGLIKNISTINFAKDGEYKATITGTLEIHGIKKEMTTDAIFLITGGQINAKCKFNILVSDYEIEIPSLVRDKIAKEVEVNINANYEPLEK